MAVREWEAVPIRNDRRGDSTFCAGVIFDPTTERSRRLTVRHLPDGSTATETHRILHPDHFAEMLSVDETRLLHAFATTYWTKLWSTPFGTNDGKDWIPLDGALGRQVARTAKRSGSAKKGQVRSTRQTN